MSYIPFRDNPELSGVAPADSWAIVQLVDEFEERARQSEHDNDACGCDAGKNDYRECVGGTRYPSVSTEEIVGMMYAAGMLTPDALTPYRGE